MPRLMHKKVWRCGGMRHEVWKPVGVEVWRYEARSYELRRYEVWMYRGMRSGGVGVGVRCMDVVRAPRRPCE